MKLHEILRLCGLDYAEASTYLNVSRREVRAWCDGRHEAPDVVILKLTALYRRQAEAADVIIDAWARAGGPPVIQVEMPSTNEDAFAQGWPCLRSVENVAAAVQLEIAPARLRVLPKSSRTADTLTDPDVAAAQAA